MKTALLLILAQFALPENFVLGRGTNFPNLPNTYGCYGNSIMAGACNAQSPCSRVGDAIPGSAISQNAVSGYTALQIRNAYFANYSTSCIDEECGTILLNGGVNSLKAPGAITGIVEQETLDYMLEVVDHALARGRRVVWIDVLPYASCDIATCPVLVDPGERARTYNALKAAACAARFSIYLDCVVAYEEFESVITPDFLATQYACSDGIHLQDTAGKTGPQLLTALILAALGY